MKHRQRRKTRPGWTWIALGVVASYLLFVHGSGRGTQLTCSSPLETLGEGETRNYEINSVLYEVTVLSATSSNVTFIINGDTFSLVPLTRHVLSTGLTVGLQSATATIATFGFDCIVIATATCSDGLQNQDETNTDCGGVCGGYWYGAACHASPQVSDQPNVSRECACCNYNGDWTTCGYFSMWPNVTCELSGAGDGSTLYTYVWPPPDPNPCIESCKDECLPGTALCVAAMDGYGRPCGNYDADPCLEWGAGQPNLNVCDWGCKADVDCGETEQCIDSHCRNVTADCVPHQLQGPTKDKIDLVLVWQVGGTLPNVDKDVEDAIVEEDLQLLHNDVGVFNMVPFSTHASSFNVWYIHPRTLLLSAQLDFLSNLDVSAKIAQMPFLTCPQTDVLVVMADISRAYSVMSETTTSGIIHTHRTEQGFWNWLTTLGYDENEELALTIDHELAHVIGHLDDEYEQDLPNIALSFTNCKVNPDDFTNLLGADYPAYRGCTNSTYYRTSPNSIMRNHYAEDGRDFNRASIYYLNEELNKWR